MPNWNKDRNVLFILDLISREAFFNKNGKDILKSSIKALYEVKVNYKVKKYINCDKNQGNNTWYRHNYYRKLSPSRRVDSWLGFLIQSRP